MSANPAEAIRPEDLNNSEIQGVPFITSFSFPDYYKGDLQTRNISCIMRRSQLAGWYLGTAAIS